MVAIIILIAYIYYGNKANEFCKRNLLGLETMYVYDICGWISNKLIWAVLIGWITIPLAALAWMFGARR